ncbi:epigen isoform X2 [Tympanuchus pallidicinctus]|uniref:epigen isoform X2 n=2 Tax=Tetraoninae TaxID=466585 RepID=UPI00209DFD29|nr:epigen isoform X2 [Lagopus muta]XP_052538118.1 epigen isoform X2 [Tympanuchus pallidicinctus]
MAFGMLIYILLKAMGALSEEAALTVSSLSTEMWNSWTKNNTEGANDVTALGRAMQSGPEVLADYAEQPRLLKLMQACLEEHHSYCINGLCAFHSELRKPICKCLAGYNGERCEHLTLNSYAHNSYERYIAVGIGIGILTSGILAIIYCYVRKRCRKLKSPYKVCMGETAL